MNELDEKYIKKFDAEIKEKVGCSGYIIISDHGRIDIHYLER